MNSQFRSLLQAIHDLLQSVFDDIRADDSKSCSDSIVSLFAMVNSLLSMTEDPGFFSGMLACPSTLEEISASITEFYLNLSTAQMFSSNWSRISKPTVRQQQIEALFQTLQRASENIQDLLELSEQCVSLDELREVTVEEMSKILYRLPDQVSDLAAKVLSVDREQLDMWIVMRRSEAGMAISF